MKRIAFMSPLVAVLLAGCVRPADERSALDLEVGSASVGALHVEVLDGQAAIQSITAESITMWAQAPVLEIGVQSAAARSLELELFNCMPAAEMRVRGQTLSPSRQPRPTHCIFEIELPAGLSDIQIAPPDWQDEEAFLFADMGDIQTAMNRVDDVFAAISAEPNLRFVMSTGDVVETGEFEEYEQFLEKIVHLDIPFFSTVGNHELTRDATRWHNLFGRFSVHFRFKGVDFSYVDSGNASLDPTLHAALQEWLEAGRERVHIFGTHYPIFDPVGVRNAGFRSRTEASKLLARLAEGNVDLTLYGHVHSLYEFQNAGIPAFISGGGGALPERLDGISRHFLVVDADPIENRIRSVEVRRVAD